MADRILSVDLDGKTKYAQTEDVLRSIALVLSNYLVYGASHHLTSESLEECWEQLTQFWGAQGLLLLGADRNHLIANEFGFPITSRNMQALEQALVSRKIPALELSPGAAKHEFRTMLALLSMSPVALDGHGGPIAYLKKNDVNKIRLSSAHYGIVTNPQTTANPLQPETISQPPPKNPDYDTTLILAYLQSDTDQYIEKVAQALSNLLHEPQLIAEKIFDAATSKSGSDAEDCDFSTLARCVRRTVNLMVNSKTGKSTEGRQLLINTLNELKKELQYSVLPEDGTMNHPAEILGKIIEDGQERLGIDKLIANYSLKRQLLLSMENRILEVLKNKGFGLSATELEQRLKGHGLTDELWEELWIKSLKNRRGGGGRKATGSGAVNQFAAFVSAPRDPAEVAHPDYINQLITHITDVELEVNALVEQARGRMDTLDQTFGKAVQSSTGPTRGQVVELARLLVVIGHGLSEPLKMVNASIELVRSGQVGPLNESQHALMQMAALAGQKVHSLAFQLIAAAEANQT